MKYLKTYESKSFEKGKYVVMKHKWQLDNLLFIYNIMNVKTTEIVVKRLYRFDINTNKLTEDNDIYYFGTKDYKPTDIIYQSDNLQDCIDRLPKLTMLKKYKFLESVNNLYTYEELESEFNLKKYFIFYTRDVYEILENLKNLETEQVNPLTGMSKVKITLPVILTQFPSVNTNQFLSVKQLYLYSNNNLKPSIEGSNGLTNGITINGVKNKM